MTASSDSAGRAGPPTVAEIAALTARLRELSTPGRVLDPAERAAFLADKHALLARIPDTDPGSPHPRGSDGEAEQQRWEQLARWHHDDQTAHEDDGTSDVQAGDGGPR